MIEFLFLLLINPLEPISIGMFSVVQPCFLRYVVKSWYRFTFLRFPASAFFSKQIESSNNNIVFWLLFIITMSGRWEVVRISVGILPPFIWWPGKSAWIVEIERSSRSSYRSMGSDCVRMFDVFQRDCKNFSKGHSEFC